VWRAANRLTNMVDGIGATYYSYDAMGLLASEDGPWANDMVSYVNLANKRRGQLQLSQPTVPAWTGSYAYDAGNRLTGKDYTYDPVGELVGASEAGSDYHFSLLANNPGLFHSRLSRHRPHPARPDSCQGVKS
jgi:hypothetical protein